MVKLDFGALGLHVELDPLKEQRRTKRIRCANIGSTNIVTGNILVPPTNQVFSYDADGNLTNDSVWAYRWDGENRLIQMSNLTAVATAGRKKLDFQYDALGRRSQ